MLLFDESRLLKKSADFDTLVLKMSPCKRHYTQTHNIYPLLDHLTFLFLGYTTIVKGNKHYKNDKAIKLYQITHK